MTLSQDVPDQGGAEAESLLGPQLWQRSYGTDGSSHPRPRGVGGGASGAEGWGHDVFLRFSFGGVVIVCVVCLVVYFSMFAKHLLTEFHCWVLRGRCLTVLRATRIRTRHSVFLASVLEHV